MKFFLVILYYFAPKVDIIPVPGSVTGIRFSDIVAVTLILILLREYKLNLKFKRTEFYLFFLLFCSFLISTVNGVINTGSIIGVIVLPRLICYAVVGFYTLEIVNNSSKTKILMLFLISGFIALLQFLLIIPNYNPGHGALLNSREFSVSFPTPAEYAYFFALFGLLVSYRVNGTLPGIYVALNLFNGVKAVALILFSYMIRFKISNLIWVTLGIIVLALFMDGLEDIKRFGVLIVELSSRDINYEDLKSTRVDEFSEKTLAHRVGKWSGAISLGLSSVSNTLFGYGTYAARGALDGGLVRLFFEHGAVGFGCVMLLGFLASTHFIMVFIFSNLFFDGFISSTVAPLLFAHYLYERRRKYRYNE